MKTLNAANGRTPWNRLAQVAGVAAVLALAATAAQADNVYWSVGVNSPGVAMGFSNAPPAPVYVAPAPVYVAPPPVAVYSPPVVVPAPAYRVGWVAPPPVWGWGRYREREEHHHRGWGHDRDGEWRGRDWR